jgi:TonB family protein
MSHLVALPNPGNSNRRRFGRFPIAVPVDVVVLRSGVPSTIPGRSVDVGEGGVSAVLAGEVQAGESIGVSLQLPFVLEPVQAKAVVRHHGPLRCGIQFIAMSPEQLTALRTWARMAQERSGALPVPQWADTENDAGAKNVVRAPAVRTPKQFTARRRVRARKSSAEWRPQLRWLVLLGIATLAALGYWWYTGWSQPDDGTVTASGAPHSVQVPGSIMQQHLLHRVDPEYPADAEKAKVEGLVVLSASIAPDGTVKNVAPVSGAPLLAQAAVNAVRWWRFQPYAVNGQAVPVETTIEIDFQLPK